LREKSNRKDERIISRFEQLVLRPRLHRNERFPLCTISQDHSVPQHLQARSRTLGPASFSLVPAKNTNTRTHKFAQGHNLQTLNTKIETLGDQLFDHRQSTLTNNDPIG